MNARRDGIERKPSFRSLLKNRICNVPASGFCEWRKSDPGKQPYFIRPGDTGTFSRDSTGQLV
ncbi:SOS response-associated peptidase family protein [Desulfoprunum benzoelyticum]|uniref:SOS response-associated peptidase family protein n=1 Tax=Desulfoprunum benzoelyticum TaxID=1506996 RepID=UPI0033904074